MKHPCSEAILESAKDSLILKGCRDKGIHGYTATVRQRDRYTRKIYKEISHIYPIAAKTTTLNICFCNVSLSSDIHDRPSKFVLQ